MSIPLPAALFLALLQLSDYNALSIHYLAYHATLMPIT